MSVSEQVGLPYGSRASSPGASLRRPFTPGGMFPSSASTAGDGRVSRSASTHGGGHGGFAPTALYHSSSTYSLRRPIEPGDRTGAVFTYSSSVLFYPLYIYLYIYIYIFYVKSIFVYIFRILVSLTPISFADQSAKEVFFSSSCWFTFSQIWRWEQRTQFNPRPRQKKLMKTKQIKKFVNLINFIPRVFFWPGISK